MASFYFAAAGTSGNTELWATDGTSTAQVAEIHPTLSSGPSKFYVWNGALYFNANNPTAGKQLYRLYEPASVQNVYMPGSVRLYPNPARDVAHLEIMPDQQVSMSVVLTDATGRAVWTKPSATYQPAKTIIDIPLSNLSTGNYWYQISGTEGQQFAGGCITKH